jgi:tRNA threonylcarbamoyladenosine biosynthesis protein TsaE
MENHLQIPDLTSLPGVATKLLELLKERRVVAFYGDMGAGKTTLIKALCDKLMVIESTSSPSFGLINEYSSEKGLLIYHFDFYRIRSIEEAFDLGYEEYFYSGNYCFIEWPEKIQSLLPEDTVKISIRVNENDSRVLELEFGDQAAWRYPKNSL